jgi:hypothetical protein
MGRDILFVHEALQAVLSLEGVDVPIVVDGSRG